MAVKNTAKKQAATKKAAANRKAKPKKKAAAKRPPAREIRPGFISHTELASTAPDQTAAWCKKVLSWKFGTPMPTPNGPYHMWNFGDNTGGGIRASHPPEQPGTIPYCEVRSIRAAHDKAVAAGAATMMPPSEIPGGFGWIAIVKAPGGVPIGLWAQK